MLSIAHLSRYLALTCLIISLLISPFYLLGCNSSKSVEGSVFVVTKGDGSYKLSLVNVKIYKHDVFKKEISNIDSVLNKRKNSFNNRLKYLTNGVLDSLNNDYHEIQMASLEAVPHSPQEEANFRNLKEIKRKRMREVLGEISNLRGEYHNLQVKSIMKRLPKPHRSVKTDADGKFSTTLETGEKYVFCATSQRDIPEGIEYYSWTHEMRVKGKGEEEIMLSNDNLAGVGRGALDWGKYRLISSDLPSISGTVAEDIARSTLEEEIFP